MTSNGRAIRVLVECFRALPNKDKRRLLDHAKKRTRICCGEDAWMYADGKGGG